jgi:hypothetical protein
MPGLCGVEERVGKDQVGQQVVYWHRELPPMDAEPIGEHVVEASSEHVASGFAQRDEWWRRCYESGMSRARVRLEQEVARLGGHYAHVLAEAVESKHDAATGQGWLDVCLTYMLYR